MKLKYSKGFEADYKWYLDLIDRNLFQFAGTDKFYKKGTGENCIQEDKDGVSAKEAFYRWESEGKIKPTREPGLLFALHRTKAAVNLQIKEYAQDRVNGLLPGVEVYPTIYEHFNVPDWFIEAVEKQKHKYVKEEDKWLWSYDPWLRIKKKSVAHRYIRMIKRKRREQWEEIWNTDFVQSAKVRVPFLESIIDTM